MLIANTMAPFKMRDVSQATSIADWMRKHGKAVRPTLSKQERAQLTECFQLMDGDGSGAIDVDELHSAFKILGLRVTKKRVAELLAKVDADGSGESSHNRRDAGWLRVSSDAVRHAGEVELPEFIQIMTMTRELEQAAAFWGDKSPRLARNDDAVPLHQLTAAYRRKRTIDNVMDSELRLTYATPSPRQSSDAR